MLGFGVDLDLRMIRTHVALAASVRTTSIRQPVALLAAIGLWEIVASEI